MLEIGLASVHDGEYIVRHADHFSWCGCGFLPWFAEIILQASHKVQAKLYLKMNNAM